MARPLRRLRGGRRPAREPRRGPQRARGPRPAAHRARSSTTATSTSPTSTAPRRGGRSTAGRSCPLTGPRERGQLEPIAAGFPLLIAPAYALGGRLAVELWLAALAALGYVAAAVDRAAPRARAVGHARRARRRAVAAGGRRRHHDRARRGGRQRAGRRRRAGAGRARAPAGAAHGLGGPAAGARCRGWACASSRRRSSSLVGVFRWPRRRQRGLAGLVGVEVALFSAVLFVSINDRLYGGLTPYAVLPEGVSPTGAHGLAAHLERWPRLLWLWVGRARGPAAVGARVRAGASSRCGCSCARAASAWRGCWASRPTSRSPPASCVAVCAAAPCWSPPSSPPRSPGRGSPGASSSWCCRCSARSRAWGWRRFPRTGAALAALTLAATLWVLVAARVDDATGVAPPRGALPWTAR